MIKATKGLDNIITLAAIDRIPEGTVHREIGTIHYKDIKELYEILAKIFDILCKQTLSER